MPSLSASLIAMIAAGVVGLVLIIILLRKSVIVIGAGEVGLVRKRIGAELKSDAVIAFNGETGYQARLKRSGIHFVIPFLYAVERHPLVQIETDEIGLVISQVGKHLPQGQRSGDYKPAFGNYEDVAAFMNEGGFKGVQRAVLQPGAVVAIHPVAFLVVTSKRVYGLPVDGKSGGRNGQLRPEDFGLQSADLKRTVIPAGKVGVVETLEGDALESDQVFGRIGGFSDIAKKEKELRDSQEPADGELTEEARSAHLTSTAIALTDLILARNLDGHHSYQDFEAFLKAGGRMGVQHDVLSPGTYNLNPYLVRVRIVPMVEVDQSEVAVIRSAAGLAAEDVSGVSFRFGSLTLPGHRGLWVYGLRTGLYPLNPEIYTPLMVPTNVITLSWSGNNTAAQGLDRELSSIEGTSKDGFTFELELQVQVHVPADQAPHLISLVGQMEHLVNGILQPVVGAFFRDAMQKRSATSFIEERDKIRAEAEEKIKAVLKQYFVQVQGVFIQAVHYPQAIAEVLQKREIAAQQKMTFMRQQEAEEARIKVESTKGTADAQAALAAAEVNVTVAKHNAAAQVETAEGAAQVTKLTAEAEAAATTVKGTAEASAIQARGEAQAAGYKAQVDALGAERTGLVAALHEIGTNGVKIVPDVMAGGNGGAGDGIAAVVLSELMQRRSSNNHTTSDGQADTTAGAVNN